MKTVLKYPLNSRINHIKLPVNAKILKVAFQSHELGENLCLWAEVDTKLPKNVRIFRTYGTGDKIPKKLHLEPVDSAISEFSCIHIYEDLTRNGAENKES